MPQNMGADFLGGYIGSVGTASTSYLGGQTVQAANQSGPFGPGLSDITRTVLHIAAFWVISIGILYLLYRAGFRFSVTVG